MEEHMTPRERVLTTINLKEPDRVPLDFTSIHPTSYIKLCKYLNHKPVASSLIPSTGKVDPLDESILKIFHSDIRRINARSPWETLPNGNLRDPYGTIWKIRNQIGYPIKYPLRDARTTDDVESYQHWPDPNDPTFTDGLEKMAKELHQKTDYAISCCPGPAAYIFHEYSYIRGFDQWFIDMRRNPDFYKMFANKLTEVQIEICRNIYSIVGDYIDIAIYYDDMGGQNGPFISVEDYKKFVKPYAAKYIKEITKLTKAKIYLHSDGSVYPLISEFIDLGADIIDPIQPHTRDMEPERLKREFGDKVCFHCAMDRQRLIPFGTIDEIKKEVKRLIHILAPSGGYIFSPSYIHPETPPENICTMFETAYKFGKYPIKKTV